ncbi:hypothetical protein M407DRAFT_242403 [Tulasnella calospora MUT 4182]|uniref:Uncharacterized protein n=1 Tax=Tulasnella calospora MUT 4182 TaxID=1051891 RepID=A0A0C3QPA3_9AGAM|nr:hypothetical protein M407DRAFT_245475 [Tulasnella calospora MUT 4182]KIO30071.1 hypothetical protein M407DRAFT_242403 [Tulasnella calospora MUT 4182]
MPLYYERTYYLSSFASPAQVVGVMSVGLLAGYDIALSYGALPSLLISGLPTYRLVVAWDNLHTKSEKFSRPIIIASLLAFIRATFRASTLPGIAYTPFGLSRRTQLALASISILAVWPLKLYSFDPLVWRLRGARTEVEEGMNINEVVTLDDHGVQEDVRLFGKRTALKAGIFVTAFFLGVTAC